MEKLGILLFVLIAVTGCSHSPYYSPKAGGDMPLDNYSYDSFFLPSDSGNQLHSVFISAKPLTSKGLVVHFHGNSGNISETVEKYLWLSDAGYDLLLFDYSGYGHSSGRANFANLRADAQSVFRFVEQQFASSDNYPLISIGTSLGGAVMLDGLIESPQRELFDLVVVDSSFHSFTKVAQHVVSQNPLGFLGAWLIPLVVDEQYNPLPRLQHLANTPLLFVHCESDALIPWQFSEKMHQQSSNNSNLELLQGCKHARTFTPESTENRPLLLSYLAQLEASSKSLETLAQVDN